ncbi:hypothetical protein AMTR_s00091p00132800 [Amborella trichopoda]|uniref:Uncharacterized protein n=1 Tax=Amborella trichopoda TaxID=13333 RepID=W1NTB4_AMBTC|nr:hypothetical protein AMTR_s00091p00132800 [Amborella trichopoda]
MLPPIVVKAEGEDLSAGGATLVTPTPVYLGLPRRAESSPTISSLGLLVPPGLEELPSRAQGKERSSKHCADVCTSLALMDTEPAPDALPSTAAGPVASASAKPDSN